MSEHHRLDDGLRWRTVGRIEAGQSQAQVARELGVTPSIVSTLWSQFQNSGTGSRRPGQGRPRATTPRENQYLLLTAKRQRTSTATQLSRDLAAATGTLVSRKTGERGSVKEGCMPGRPPFASHSLPSTKESVHNGADSTNTGHSSNGLMFCSQMSPDSGFNLILGEY